MLDLTLTRVLRADPAAPWAERLAGTEWRQSARTLKRHDGHHVLAADLADTPAVLKVWPLTGVRTRLQILTASTRGHRHWRGAEALAAAGVATARPLLLATARFDGAPSVVLLMERLGGRTLLAHLADAALTDADRARLAHAVGEQIGLIARAGRFNRDHKPSNIVVTRLDERDASLAVIDSVAIRRSPGRRLAPLARMVASLVVEPAGVGSPMPMPMVRSVVGAAVAAAFPAVGDDLRPRLAAVVARLAGRRLASHRDPTPRHDPLA